MSVFHSDWFWFIINGFCCLPPTPFIKKRFGFVDCDLVWVTIWTVTECFGEFWNVGFSQSKFEFAYEGHAAGLALPKSGQTYFFSNSALLIAYVKELLMWNWQTVKMEYLWNSGELMCIGSYWFTQLQYCIKINALDVSNIYFLNVSLSGMQIRMKIC